MRLSFFAAALVAAVFVSTGAAAAPCAPRAALAAALLRDWGEAPRFRGLAEGGRALVELFLAPSGSWSVLATRPDGVACLLAAGEAGEPMPPAGLPDAPAARPGTGAPS